jgi:hypothetical protein
MEGNAELFSCAVKKWPKEDYGSFYQGDSYIVLRTYMEKNKFLYDIFFWLGTDTTQVLNACRLDSQRNAMCQLSD